MYPPRLRSSAVQTLDLNTMIISFAKRMLTEVDTRLLWKFAYNFGLKGAVSVERYKSRLKRDIHFPPFLFISVINSCNLRCQGCWVDVAAKQSIIDADTLNRTIKDAKKHGNVYFGILGGEPFMHTAWRGRRSAACVDRKSTRLNSSHSTLSRMPSSA